MMIKKNNIYFFKDERLKKLSFLILLTHLFLAEASDKLTTDTLMQIASTEISLNQLPPELENSKKILEQNNSSKTREQLYREIFGIPPPKPPRQVEASLTVNEKVNGRIEVIFNEDRTDFLIPAPPVISMISEMISAELLNVVKSKINSSGQLTKTSLDSLRLETTFESEDYLVHIEIPPDLLSKQIHDLSGYREDPYIIENTKPNSVSIFLNASINERLKYYQSNSDDTTNTYYKITRKLNENVRQPVISNIDGAINIKGVVLEGGATYNEIFDHPIQKNAVRLIYDLPKKCLRFTAGDITYKKSGYLSYVPMGGIGISKEYTLQPHILSYPVSDKEFFLSEQSEVDVWVNDVLVKSMILEPGTHDIRGFPFASGSNNVRIEIKDFSGRFEKLEFSFVHDPVLLAKGKSQYICNIGLSSRINRNEYVYNVRDPYLLGTYKRGLTDNFTFEVYGQSFLDRGIAGANGTYALSHGNLHLDLAGSYDKKEGPDFGAKFGFFYRSKVSYLKMKNPSSNYLHRINPITWNSEVEYLGGGFPERLHDSTYCYEKCLSFSSNLLIPMAGQFNLNLKSSYSIYPDSNNIFEINVGFQKTLFKSLRAGANLGYSSDVKTNRANPSVSVQAQWTFFSGPNSFAINETVKRQPPVSIDTLTESNARKHEWNFNTDIKWDYLENYQRPEKIDGGLTAHVSEMYSEYNGRIGYKGNGGSIVFNQNLGTPGYFQDQFIQHQSDLTLKSAVVFVDGKIALSRPIYNGFLVAKGAKNLKGSKIRVNPHGADDYEATSTWFGPAVLPLHSPYVLQKVKLSPLNQSVSSINDKMDFTLYPHYKSGFLLTIGTDITVLAIGTLLDSSGMPLCYQSITISSADDEKFASINTFTNQAGKFQFMGTAGHTYEMHIDGSSADKAISITIPKDKNDFYRVGDIITGKNSPEITDANDSTNLSVNSSASDSVSDKQLILKRAAESERRFIIDSIVTEEVITWDTAIDRKASDRFVNQKIPKSHVFGTLLDSTGTPMPSASFDVRLIEDSSAATISSFTDKDGRFQIICATPGRYRIATTQSPDSGLFTGADTFTVTAEGMGSHQQKGKPKLDIGNTFPFIPDPNERSIQVIGTIEDKDGQLLRYTPVSLISIDTTVNSITDNNGSFQIICRKPGMYKIYITGSKTNIGAFINVKSPILGILNVGRQRIAQ